VEERLKKMKDGRRLRVFASVLVVGMVVAGGLMMVMPARAGNGVLLAYVDVGEDEKMAVMYGWGPIEPDSNDGDWGGYGVVTSPLYGQKTRVMWYEDWLDDEKNYDPNGREGSVKVNFVGSARLITFDHLDGLADDSFKLYALGDYGPIEIFSYVDLDPASDTETWMTETVELGKFIGCDGGPIWVGGCKFTLVFEATCEIGTDEIPWWGWPEYGSVAIDNILVFGNGVEIAHPIL